MPTYEIITLVDITNSKLDRDEVDLLRSGQKANFNTLLQTVGLRANFSYAHEPKKDRGALPYNIGGKATYWSWQFTVEQDSVYTKGNDPLGLLKEDLHGVPIVDGLNNTLDFNPPIFQTQGDGANTWIFDFDSLDK